jgi:hypothetical protein
MEYRLDTNAARAADNIFRRIEQNGKYRGRFTKAEAVVSTKGSQGVEFSFETDDGETANYLTVWTENGEGKRLRGFDVLMAIMTCLRVKVLREEIGEVDKYDPEYGKMRKQNVPLFKDLMGKPVGLLITMEEYRKSSGDTAWKPQIFAPFDMNEFTASEILEQAKTPEKLARMVQTLRDRPLAAVNPAGAAPRSDNAPPDPFSDMADDIPF